MKLKPIPLTTVVHTPTEEEAKELLAILHENGWKWHLGEALYEFTNWNIGKNATCYKLYIGNKRLTYDSKGWFVDNNEPILTLAEFKERYCEDEKPQPKFKVGDKVRIIQDGTVNPDYVGIVDEIAEVGFVIKLKNTDSNWDSEALEPYTQPETKPTEDMEAKGKELGETGNNSEISQSNNLSQDVANCDKPEDKELNLCELLKGHEGETFYSPFYGDVTLEEIHTPTVETPKYYLLVRPKSYSVGRELILPNGINHDGGQVVLYPSRALYEQYPLDPYTAWMKWQEEQNIKCRIWLSIETKGERTMPIKGFDTIFRTPADRDKCLSEIEVIIEKYSKK